MQYTILLEALAIIGSACAISGFLLMRRKFLKELAKRQEHEEELAGKIYESRVLKEIGERIGYSLDALKIVEIISGSLGKLLLYSTASYMVMSQKLEKIIFSCKVNETVSREFIDDVKVKMLAAFSEMIQAPVVDSDLDESISGALLDAKAAGKVVSYFNLPIVILGKPVGIINIASTLDHHLYTDENTEVLYRIAKQASEAVSKLQEVLENEKSRLMQAVQSLSDGLLMVDKNFRLVLVNKKLEDLLGTVPSPSLFDVVNALSGHLDLRVIMEEAIQKDLPVASQEIVVKGKILQVIASKVIDSKTEEATGLLVVFHDITDAKSIEKLRREFMAMMVHELRAPLTSIKATTELLQGELSRISTDELGKHLKIIDSTSQTMLEVVNDLLDVAKLEAGKFDVVCDEGRVEDAVLERVESIKPQAHEKSLKVTCEVEEGLPDGYFDKIRIKQVLNNLLSNSLKYTEHGEIKLKVAQEVIGGHPVDILVSVSDTGIGIEPEGIGTLFSKFAQLKAGRKQAGLKSSGLGLFIAKGIVDAWGGKIWGESQGAGLGSTFYFTVPLALTQSRDKSHKFESPSVGFKIRGLVS